MIILEIFYLLSFLVALLVAFYYVFLSSLAKPFAQYQPGIQNSKNGSTLVEQPPPNNQQQNIVQQPQQLQLAKLFGLLTQTQNSVQEVSARFGQSEEVRQSYIVEEKDAPQIAGLSLNTKNNEQQDYTQEGLLIQKQNSVQEVSARFEQGEAARELQMVEQTDIPQMAASSINTKSNEQRDYKFQGLMTLKQNPVQEVSVRFEKGEEVRQSQILDEIDVPQIAALGINTKSNQQPDYTFEGLLNLKQNPVQEASIRFGQSEEVGQSQIVEQIDAPQIAALSITIKNNEQQDYISEGLLTLKQNPVQEVPVRLEKGNAVNQSQILDEIDVPQIAIQNINTKNNEQPDYTSEGLLARKQNPVQEEVSVRFKQGVEVRQSSILEEIDAPQITFQSIDTKKNEQPDYKFEDKQAQIKESHSEMEAQSEIVQQCFQVDSHIDKVNIKKARQQRERKRLQAVKNHYKKIISELKQKLESACIRNNQSFSVGDPNETIVFSQDSYLHGYQNEQQQVIEMKVQQVCSLQQQLKLQQQIISNLLQEDLQLKEKMITLEIQNKNLKQSKLIQQRSSFQKSPSSDVIMQSQKQSEQEIINNLPMTSRLQQKFSENSSPIKNMFSSQIGLSNQRPSTLFFSRVQQNPISFSAISMMSVVEGAISIGLLSQCRFLNQISKRFTINQIKKITKKKFVDSELLFNLQNTQNIKQFSPFLKGRQNILILMKLVNGKTIASFIESPVFFMEQQPEQDKDAFLVLLDLGKRKSTSTKSRCHYADPNLIFGNNQLVLKDSLPITVSSQGFGNLIASKQKAIAIFQSHNQDIQVQFLLIYALTPQVDY